MLAQSAVDFELAPGIYAHRGRLNPPDAAPTAENGRRGILFVLMPGYGPAVPIRESGMTDEAWAARLSAIVRPRGFASSPQIDRGSALPTVYRWLRSAGLPADMIAKESRITVWPPTWGEEAGALHADQWVMGAVRRSGGFLKTLEALEPRLVVFVSNYLLRAVNQPQLAERLAASIGRPASPARRLTDTRLRVMGQRWTRAALIALPIPSPNATAAFEAELKNGLSCFFENG